MYWPFSTSIFTSATLDLFFGLWFLFSSITYLDDEDRWSSFLSSWISLSLLSLVLILRNLPVLDFPMMILHLQIYILVTRKLTFDGWTRKEYSDPDAYHHSWQERPSVWSWGDGFSTHCSIVCPPQSAFEFPEVFFLNSLGMHWHEDGIT